MWLANYYQTIPQQWHHSPEIQDNQGYTVAMNLAYNKQNIPTQWWHDTALSNKRKFTVALIYASQGRIPPKEWQHDKFKTDQFGRTVATNLAKNEIIPTQYWMITETENENLLNNLKYYLFRNDLPVPLHVKDEELTIFDQACYRIVPQLGNHKPDEQNEDGFTVAMILTINKIKIPEEWYHDPSIKNKYGYTVALYMAKDGVIPDKHWYHDKYFRTRYQGYEYSGSYTVQNLLLRKNIDVPEEWKYDFVIDTMDTTQAMKQAKRGIIPDKQYYHRPDLQNTSGYTVAFYLVEKRIIPPKEWQHDPTLKNCYDYTVALSLAEYSIIPPKEWEHNKFITNFRSKTIAEILSSKGIIPPSQWMINEDENKQIFDQICNNLRKHFYIYANNQFIFNLKTVVENNTCQICFNDGQQQFIETTCGHQVCLDCFKELLRQQSYSCPICRQKAWYLKIQEDDYSDIFTSSYDESYESYESEYSSS